ELVRDHNLTDQEYGLIEALLGRAPTFAELGVFSALWSEHCSYKHSRPILQTFPTAGPQVVQGPGENAGVLRLPDGWAVAFKIESHNHPSAVEPYQGAATGVGGSSTGRAGIPGASFASEELTHAGERRRPQVRVGAPFTEKLLLEASLELIASGHIVAIQDMGAAGLTSSSAEMAAKGGVGV